MGVAEALLSSLSPRTMPMSSVNSNSSSSDSAAVAATKPTAQRTTQLAADPKHPADRPAVAGAVDACIRLLRTLHAQTSADWLAMDLTMGQLKALVAVVTAQPTTVGHLADALGLGLPATSALAFSLVRLGLVERQQDDLDRRRVYLSLSAAGEELVANLRHGRRERLRALLAAAGDAELVALDQAISGLLDASEFATLSAGRCTADTAEAIDDDRASQRAHGHLVPKSSGVPHE